MSTAQAHVESVIRRAPLVARKPPAKTKEPKPKVSKPKTVRVLAPVFRDHDTGAVIKGLPAPMPCPFCKRTDSSVAIRGRDDDDPAYVVECGYCGGESPYGKSQLEAANLWNGALGGVDMAHRYRLDNLSIRARSVLLRGLKVVLDNSKSDDEFEEAQFLSTLLADFEPPKQKRKQFTDIDNGAPIDGLPEPAPCPFCGFHEWTGIVTKPPADTNDIATYHVQCDGCFAEGSPQASKLEAAQYWNKAAKVDYSIIQTLDAVNLSLTHLSDALVLTTSTLREEGVAEDAPVAACLESVIDAKLEPAREQLAELLQKLSAPKTERIAAPPVLALTG